MNASHNDIVELQQLRIAELEAEANNRWAAFGSGMTLCFRWEYVNDVSDRNRHNNTGFLSAAMVQALHDLLNSCDTGMLDDHVIASAPTRRDTVAGH